MAIFGINFDVFANTSTVKAEARKAAFEAMYDFFKENLGEELVSVVGNNELAVVVGQKTDKDSCPVDVVVTIKPTCKDWEDRKTASKVFEAFDRDAAAEAFAKDKAEKAEKDEKAKKTKVEKLAKEKAEKAAKAQAKADKAKAEADAVAGTDED